MDAKKILLSDASVEAKLAAIAILLGKELPQLKANVEFVQKLQGPQGERGADGKDGKVGPKGKDGKDGVDGRNGKDGIDGEDGDNGVSIVGAKIDFDGSLVLTFSDGRELNVGEVVPFDVAEKIRVITSGGGGGASLPDQTGNAGKYLTTDGINPSWATAQKTITSGTAAPSGGVDGDIYLQYV